MTRVVVGLCQRTRSDGEAEYLLVRSSTDYGKFTSYYSMPGGKAEPNETEEETLKREFREELGVDVVPVRKIVETDGDLPDSRVYWWECTLFSDSFNLQEHEIIEASFLTKAQIEKADAWPATKAFFKKYV